MKLFLTISTILAFSLTSKAQLLSRDSSWQSQYRASATKVNDLVHTRLEAKFDYAKSYMNGKVTITLTPHFYSVDSLQLDAKGMDIAKVNLVKGTSQTPLKFTYDGWHLKMKLDRTYKTGEKYTVFIEYTAKPNEAKVKGSGAINDAKGLYFINPKGEDKTKPTQIWTQGETEGTSVWCPTIDRPNQRCTDEIIMTVPDKYVTLSNGKLFSQVKNTDGTRTDDWKMELPHAPYLFFMAVGDYSIIRDKYKGKEVNYYVRKEYAPVARKIFGLTPKMIGFYEKITGVTYPWVKYSQITGIDYVSGAMENTTATLHQESAEQDARQLVDGNGWEGTIAHELFHQWFGDYVTCESWSNLTVNESFADYSQYLWKEHYYGADEAGAENYSEMMSYFSDPDASNKHLVRFYYSDKEDMFDLVSYQKGGRILNMLRNAVGDSAFFKGLNLYLTTNKFKTGEAHQLRLAMEEVSGKDLNWFFDQWYFGSGQPKVNIRYSYNESVKKAEVSIRQLQGGHLFKIPLVIDVYQGGSKTSHNVWVNKAEETFIFDAPSRPDLINVDAAKATLWEKTDEKTIDNYIFQYSHAGNYVDRREAIDACLAKKEDPAALSFLKTAVLDKYYGLRNVVLDGVDLKNEEMKKQFEPILLTLAKTDKKPTVRANALELLAEYDNKEYKDLFVANLYDSSYSVAGAALAGLSRVDSDAALAEAKKQMKLPSHGDLAEAISGVLIEFGTEADFDYVADKYEAMPLSQAKFGSTMGFEAFLEKVKDTDKVKRGVDLIVSFRDAIPKAFREQTDPTINGMILSNLIKKKETDGLKDQVEYIKSKLPK